MTDAVLQRVDEAYYRKYGELVIDQTAQLEGGRPHMPGRSLIATGVQDTRLPC